MDWLSLIMFWRHADWRPTVDYRMRRWENGAWQYREMTAAELRKNAQERAW